MPDPESLKEIGVGIGAALVAAAGAIKYWKIKIAGPSRADRIIDLSAQVDGRFKELCGRLESLEKKLSDKYDTTDRKYEETHVMLRTYMRENAEHRREHGERLARVETLAGVTASNHGHRLDDLERE